MCRRLASVGYYVVLPNLYYRSGVMELGSYTGPDDGPTRARMFELMASLTIPLIMSDTEALLAFIDSQPAAQAGAVGAVGYCMSGQFAVNAATHFPGRVTAAASIYGVRLVTDEPDSPHLAPAKTKAELYFACAEVDQWAPLEMVEKLRLAVADCAPQVEVELYPGVEHGFAFPGRGAYNRDAAERHWERLFALFGRRL